MVFYARATKDGELTGGIDVVAYGDGKYHATKAWADANGVDLMQCYFYTDSMVREWGVREVGIGGIEDGVLGE